MTTYQQIYGHDGAEANEIRNQVFYMCLMPPSNASEVLTDYQRWTLWEWLACGALDSPALADGGSRD